MARAGIHGALWTVVEGSGSSWSALEARGSALEAHGALVERSAGSWSALEAQVNFGASEFRRNIAAELCHERARACPPVLARILAIGEFAAECFQERARAWPPVPARAHDANHMLYLRINIESTRFLSKIHFRKR